MEVACGEEEEAANRTSLLGYQKTNGTNPQADSLFFWGCPDHVHDGPAGSGPPACFPLPTAFHGDILLPSPDSYPHPQVTRASSPPCLHFCPIGG